MTDEITARAGREFYTFDGRILEVFGSHPRRFHIRNMDLRVTGPDRKGRRTVEIVAGSPEAPAGAAHMAPLGRGMAAGAGPGSPAGSGTDGYRVGP
ncbi:hypothetical protein ACFVZJ_19540 [Streptomyces sp. NPDC058322]|uniref:hypothetical protein n=1 Tax=Streptomyces sp. NPDC058322 TaxID=3346446 RepID=UPI0036ED1FC0